VEPKLTRGSGAGPKPPFVDAGAFYARSVATAQRHEWATAGFEAIGDGAVPYRPLYTPTDVLDELATLVFSHRDHEVATAAIERAVGHRPRSSTPTRRSSTPPASSSPATTTAKHRSSTT
jgi:hypothetical protein